MPRHARRSLAVEMLRQARPQRVAAAWTRGVAGPPLRSTHGVHVVVFPMTTYSTDPSVKPLAAQVTEGVARELARLGTVEVVSHVGALQAAAEHRPLPHTARALRADVVVVASVSREHAAVRLESALG